MNEVCILCDFDGTITSVDGLYSFISTYAQGDWECIEQMWVEGKISSKECLTEEFNLIPDISEEMISTFVKTVEIDEYFKKFYEKISGKNIDLIVVSDGIDYFINKILKRNGVENIKIISNHGEFRGEYFEITFPNDYEGCIHNAGTCKCKVLSDLRDKYKQIIYIGDGVSDFCVADKPDILFAKSKLAEFCEKEKLNYIKYTTFNDILNSNL